MILSRRVALNGQYLDTLYGSIVIRGIEFDAPKGNIQTVSKFGGSGQRVTSHRYESLDVTVKWAMDVPKTDLITRRLIYEDVCRWAMQTGWLTVNFMPDRRMWVDETELSSAGDLREWTEEYTITFRAYSVPFWQDIVPDVISKTNVSSSVFSMMIPGQFRTAAEADFTNTSGSTVTSFSITVNGSTIALTGLTLANSKKLSIYHEENGILRIRADGTSVYDKRTAASADDLYADPGVATVSMTAGGAGTLKVSVRGRYA